MQCNPNTQYVNNTLTVMETFFTIIMEHSYIYSSVDLKCIYTGSQATDEWWCPIS